MKGKFPLRRALLQPHASSFVVPSASNRCGSLAGSMPHRRRLGYGCIVVSHGCSRFQDTASRNAYRRPDRLRVNRWKQPNAMAMLTRLKMPICWGFHSSLLWSTGGFLQRIWITAARSFSQHLRSQRSDRHTRGRADCGIATRTILQSAAPQACPRSPYACGSPGRRSAHGRSHRCRR